MFPIIDDICQQFLIYIANNRTDVNAVQVNTSLNHFVYTNSQSLVVQMCSKYTLEVMASCGMGVEAQTFTNDQSPFITMTEQIYTHGSLLKTTAVLFLPALGRVLQMPYVICRMRFISFNIIQYLNCVDIFRKLLIAGCGPWSTTLCR